MNKLESIFKAYDVRGIYPEQIDAQVAERIGQAYAAVQKPRKVAVGRDVRASGEELKRALIKGLLGSGIDVVDIGVITTDQLYFAVGNYGFDGGLSVTASHNPSEYNGIKFIGPGGQALSSKELLRLRDATISCKKISQKKKGILTKQVILPEYIDHVMTYINKSEIKPLHVVANANFGAVSKIIDIVAQELDLMLDKLNWRFDGSFPKGTPNPMLQENRQQTVRLIKKTKPDFGVAWDADADRCFFFTGSGVFVPSCFIISLLATKFLSKHPGSSIVHDMSVNWVIDDTIRAANGKPVSSAVGHTFIKAKMREVDAPFAAESSGHYLFKNSYYADNGVVPFLLILQLVSTTKKSLEELVKPLMLNYFVSGEINFQVGDTAKTLGRIEKEFGLLGTINKIDGLAIENSDWRFTVRTSNTEPLLRLNAESKDQAKLAKLVEDVTGVIASI